MRNRFEDRQNGFTLIEMLVATAVFLIAISIAASVLQLGQFDLSTNKNSHEVQQHANAAMKYLSRDITNSGQGYLQGSSTGSVNGPLLSIDAFRNITGINLPGPPDSPNSQPLFSLVPYSRADNLGNGDTPDEGSSDRLTVSYQDEFFAGQTYRITKKADGQEVSTVFFPVMRGRWQAGSRSFIVNADSTTTDPNDPTQNLTISYNLANIRIGDILMLTDAQALPTVTPTPVLAIVTDINSNSLTFNADPLQINRFNVAIPTVNGNPDPKLIYPLDRIQNDSDVTVTRIKIYTYLTEVNSHDLIRRRYTNPASGLLGDAFINDPICQNVERVRFTYNRVLPGVPPTFTPTLTNDLSEITPATDILQIANTFLPNLQGIRRINVTLIVRSSDIDRRNRQPARLGIQSSFSPRNISYTTNQNAS